MKLRLFILPLLIHLFVVATAVRASWQPNGNPVSTALNNQGSPNAVSDGAGGAIAVWSDLRNGNYDIYAQRISANGVVQWAVDGVPLCTEAHHQSPPAIVSDGAGGAIVLWFDPRAGNGIYAQRVNAAGVVQWLVNGVEVCPNASVDLSPFPAAIADGAGGVIVAWRQDVDIHAQRIDASGTAQWTTNGVAICAEEGEQYGPSLASDGAGGAIVTWLDARYYPQIDVFAQRVNASGITQWTTDGLPLGSIAADYQSPPAIIPDAAGGAIVAWADYRRDIFFQDTADIFAQRVNASGVLLWGGSGADVFTGGGHQYMPAIGSDGLGGAIVTWSTGEAQRIDGSGAVQWPNPASIPSAAFVLDGSGGAIFLLLSPGAGYDIWAQRWSLSTGAAQWSVPLCTAANDQIGGGLVADGTGGAIGVWEDQRSGTNADVYARRVTGDGSLPTAVGAPTPAFSVLVSDNYPNPFSTQTAFDLTITHDSRVTVEVFDAAGHRVRAMDSGTRKAGVSYLSFDGLDEHAHALPSGVYFCRVHAGAETVTKKIVITR